VEIFLVKSDGTKVKVPGKIGNKGGPGSPEKPGHKYRKREWKGDHWDYVYEEPKPKGPKKPEPEKKPKKASVEQQQQIKVEVESPFSQYHEAEDLPKVGKAGLDEHVRLMDGFSSEASNEKVGFLAEAFQTSGIGVEESIDWIFDLKSSFYGFKSTVNEGIKISGSTLAIADDEIKAKAVEVTEKAMKAFTSSYMHVKTMNDVFSSNLMDKLLSRLDDIGEQSGKFSSSYIANLRGFSKLWGEMKNTFVEVTQSLEDYKNYTDLDPRLRFMQDKTVKQLKIFLDNKDIYQSKFNFRVKGDMDELIKSGDISNFTRVLDDYIYFVTEDIGGSLTYSESHMANLWNQKKFGFYDSAIRDAAKYTKTLVGSLREMADNKDKNIDKALHVLHVSGAGGISFLNGEEQIDFDTHGPLNEMALAYADEHGFDNYFQDMIFMIGIGIAQNNGKEELAKKLYSIVNEPDKDISPGDIAWSVETRTENSMINMVTLLAPPDRVHSVSKQRSFIRLWSVESHKSTCSSAIELFANEKSVDRNKYTNYHLTSGRCIVPKRKSIRKSLLTAVNDLYRGSQEKLKTDYPGGTLTLYRGNGPSEVRNIYSSWTTDEKIAKKFGPVVSEAQVPLESVLSYHEYESGSWSASQKGGIGWGNENEHILMPGITDKQVKYGTDQNLEKHEEIPGKMWLDGVGYVNVSEKKSIMEMVFDYLTKAKTPKKKPKKKPVPKKATEEKVPTEKELKATAMEQIPSSTEGYGVYKPKDDKEKKISAEYYGTGDEWKEAMKRTGKKI
jgi:hypothetical protein